MVRTITITIGVCVALAAAPARARDTDQKTSKNPAEPALATYPGFTPFGSRAVPLSSRDPEGPGPAPALGCYGAPDLSGSSYSMWGFHNGGVAVKDEVWTFDHAPGDPWEGWTSLDLNSNNFTAFQVIDAGVWGSHGDAGSAPLIDGLKSLWVGFHEDEADAACWEGGLGYGNNWAQKVVSPEFTNNAGTVTVEFDYWINSEANYDFVTVKLDDNVSPVTIGSFTGAFGSPVSPIHFVSNNVSITGTFRVVIEFASDAIYSDEDDLYSTTEGPFCVDNINVTGHDAVAGPAPPYDFESGLDGWIPGPIITNEGKVAMVANVNDYGGPPPGCGVEERGVVFHNPNQQHPPSQSERIVSPAVPLPDFGGVLNIFADYDILADTPYADEVYWTWKVIYYPVTCAATGGDIWSDPAGPPYVFFHPSPECLHIRSFFNDLTLSGASSSGAITVPAGADSVRFIIDVYNYNSEFYRGNWTPMFDNISIGISDQNTVYHVPSPTYPDIWSAISASGVDDTVLVEPGLYSGGGNTNLTLDGINRVIMSVLGSSETTIDMESGNNRAFTFNNGETNAAVFQGFTLLRGAPNVPGACLRVGPNPSSPIIRDVVCAETNQTTGGDYGVVMVDAGAPKFNCVDAKFDTSASDVVIVVGGAPEFNTCSLTNNVAANAVLRVQSAGTKVEFVTAAFNLADAALYTDAAIGIADSDFLSNSSVGMYFGSGPGSTVDRTESSLNGDEGVVLEANSSWFDQCVFNKNLGSGMAITSVVTAAAAGEKGPEPAPEASATQPLVTDTRIQGNHATNTDGGGIRIDCSNAPVTTFAPQWISCIITGNSTAFSGGGVSVCGDATFAEINPSFYNSTIASNAAVGNGGGIYQNVSTSGSDIGRVVLYESILSGNCTVTGGPDAYSYSPNLVEFSCSLLDVHFVKGNGEFSFVESETLANPWFCETPACDFVNGTVSGNFDLSQGSKAEGTNNTCGVTMGAGAPDACGYPTAADDDGRAETALFQNVPNPFNPATTIAFTVREASYVTLRIYDVSGRIIRTLVDGTRSPGRIYNMIWDGRDSSGARVASGVYFYQLATGDFAETKKLVLLK